MSKASTGLFIDREGRVGVALANGIVVRFALTPDELRSFAAGLLVAAERAPVSTPIDAPLATMRAAGRA